MKVVLNLLYIQLYQYPRFLSILLGNVFSEIQALCNDKELLQLFAAAFFYIQKILGCKKLGIFCRIEICKQSTLCKIIRHWSNHINWFSHSMLKFKSRRMTPSAWRKAVEKHRDKLIAKLPAFFEKAGSDFDLHVACGDTIRLHHLKNLRRKLRQKIAADGIDSQTPRPT